MLPAAPYLLPVSVLYLIYKYLRSGGTTELPEVRWVSLYSGARNGDPPHRNNDSQTEPSDADPAILDEIRKLIRKLDPADLDKIREIHPDFLDEIRKLDPAVLDENRKFEPAALDQHRKLCLEENKEGGEEAERSCNRRETETEDKSENVNEKQSEESDGGGQNKNENGDVDEGSSRKGKYPARPAAGDCMYYLKTGTCKFGSNCKFNHPHRRKKNQVSKDQKKESDESAVKPGTDHENSTSGGPKNGKARSRNNFGGGSSVAPTQKLNFLGLPIRPGKKECPYYMRNASCIHGTRCWFTHPEPTAAGEPKLPSGGNDGPPSSEGASSQMAAPWSSPSSLNNTLSSQGISSQNTEWKSYQAPAYLPERNMPTRPPIVFNSVTETDIYNQYPQQQQVQEFPDRPGQLVCSYFLRTGGCKYKSNCKFHHPKTQTAVSPSSTLSDKGFPLRPGQNICTQYSHYGLCNSGEACPFDHPSLSTSNCDSATTNEAGTASWEQGWK